MAYLIQQRSHFFLNFHERFRSLGALHRSGQLTLEIGRALRIWVSYFGPMITPLHKRCMRRELTFFARLSPGRELGRVQPLATEQSTDRSSITVINTSVGFFQYLHLVRRGEAASSGRR